MILLHLLLLLVLLIPILKSYFQVKHLKGDANNNDDDDDDLLKVLN